MQSRAHQLAIVMGGAQGIGQAIAGVFAQEDATVAIVDRHADAGRITALQLSANSHRALFVKADISD